MSRLVQARAGTGYQDLVGEDNGYTKFLRFGIIKLPAGTSHISRTEGFEAVGILLTGTATVKVESRTWGNIGGRTSVFEGEPTSVYIPAHTEYEILAETDLEVALCIAATEEKFEPFIVTPEEVRVDQRGEKNWKRTIRDILTDRGEGRVSTIVVGETINDPGHWSSYPPHKHDGEFAPEEPNFEEIYHFRVAPIEGFGVQLHYTKDREIDEAHIVRDGDTYVIERGYHPLAGAGEHSVYYLWVMAGDTGRKLNPYIDPDFTWLLPQADNS
jgi:5-deoxy-glucuronate isomerase